MREVKDDRSLQIRLAGPIHHQHNLPLSEATESFGAQRLSLLPSRRSESYGFLSETPGKHLLRGSDS